MANYTKYVERNGDNATYSTDLQSFSEASQAIMSMLPFKSPAILGNYDEGNILKTGALYYNGVLYAPPTGIAQYTENQYLYAVAEWDSTSVRTVTEGTSQVTYKQRITYYQKVQATQVADVDNGDGTGSWLIGQITSPNMRTWRRNIFGDPQSLIDLGALPGDVIVDGTMDGSAIMNNSLDGASLINDSVPGAKLTAGSVSPDRLSFYVPYSLVSGWRSVQSGGTRTFNLSDLITLSNNVAQVTGLQATSAVSGDVISIVLTSLSIANAPDVIVLPMVIKNQSGVKIKFESGVVGGVWSQEVTLNATSSGGVSYTDYFYNFLLKRISDSPTNGYALVGYTVGPATQIF